MTPTPDKTTTQLLAALGVRHEASGQHALRRLYTAHGSLIGTMDVRAAYAFIEAARAAA